MATWTDEQIQNLREAIAAGVLSVRHGDKMLTYQSLPEMRKALAAMEGQRGRRRRRYALVQFSRGE